MAKQYIEIKAGFTKKQKRKLLKIVKISHKYLDISDEETMREILRIYYKSNIKII